MTTWLDAFNSIVGYLKESKTIITLDEFPWIIQKTKDIETEIFSFWEYQNDLYHGQVNLILCGSQLSMMKKIMEENRPLYGRKTADIYLTV